MSFWMDVFSHAMIRELRETRLFSGRSSKDPPTV